MRVKASAVCVVVGLALVASACGDDSDPTISTPSATSAPGPSVTSGTSLPPTTPFTFANRDTAPFVPGEGTLTLTGDVQATARFSATSCSGITVTAPRGVVASLAYFTDQGGPGSRRFVLDVAGISPGRTTFPEAAGFNQDPPRRVRLSVDSQGDVLQWGTTAAGEGSVSGTVTAGVANAKTGTFDLHLGFVGSERGTATLSSHGPVHLTGNWECP